MYAKLIAIESLATLKGNEVVTISGYVRKVSKYNKFGSDNIVASDNIVCKKSN